MTPPLSEPPLIDFATSALFLDFDGTLVELAETPQGVIVPYLLIETLRALDQRLSGRLALVSGRAIAVLDGFGMQGFAIAGSHGAEWRLPNGSGSALERPAGLDTARQHFAAFAQSAEGLLFEDKPLGAALHYRLAPDRRDAAHALAARLAEAHGLHLQHGHDMVELRKPGVNKGTGILALMELAPFAGHLPVFVGDDVTDEDGFDAVRTAGGLGVLVGDLRATFASHRLNGVDAVNDWLAQSLSAAKNTQGAMRATKEDK